MPYSPIQLLAGIALVIYCAIAVPVLIVQIIAMETYDFIRVASKRRIFIRSAILFFAVVGSLITSCGVVSGGVFRSAHAALVAQSGIRPHLVGTHEGVGVSSQGYAAARSNACFWGKRQALTVQYSKRGGLYYAVVRYR